MRLDPLDEIIGVLTSYQESEISTTLVFTIQRQIILPKDAIPSDQLQQVLGKHIGLFNYDGVYKIREIQQKKKAGHKQSSKEGYSSVDRQITRSQPITPTSPPSKEESFEQRHKRVIEEIDNLFRMGEKQSKNHKKVEKKEEKNAARN